MFMLPVNLFLMVFGTGWAMLADGATLNRDLYTGIFAWCTPDYLWQGVRKCPTDSLCFLLVIPVFAPCLLPRWPRYVCTRGYSPGVPPDFWWQGASV